MARALVWLRGQPLDFKIKKHIFLSSHVYVVEEMNVTCVLKGICDSVFDFGTLIPVFIHIFVMDMSWLLA